MHDISAIWMKDKVRKHSSMKTILLVNVKLSPSRGFDPF